MANLLANFLQGYNAGSGISQNAVDLQRQNQLATLSSRAYSTAPEGRNALLGQMAAISPQAAQAQQQGFQQQDQVAQGQEDRRHQQLAGAARYLDQARQTGNPAAVQGAWQAVRTMLQREIPGDYPEQWDDATMAPTLYQVLAQTGGGAQGNVQSTYVDGSGNRVAIMRDGRTQVLGLNDAGANQQTLTIDVNGVPTQVTFDRRTGRYTNAAIGDQQAPRPGLYSTPNGPAHIDDNLTPEQWQLAQADMASAGASDSYQFPNRDVNPQQFQAGAGTPLIGRRKEDEAAAVEAAKQAAQLQYLPQELGMRTNAAIQQTVGQERAKNQVEREANEPKRQQAVAQTIRTIDNVIRTVDKAINQVSPWTAGPGAALSAIPGTDARDLAATVTTIKANLGFDRLQQMRDASPTGGALGQVAVQELEALQAALGNLDRAQSPAQLVQNLQLVKSSYENWKTAVQQADQQARSRVGAQQPAAPSQSGGSTYSNLWN